MSRKSIHEWCDGVSGMGKTEYQRARLHPLLRQPRRLRPSIFVFDHKASLGKSILLDLYRDRLLDDVLVEDFDPKRCLGYDYLDASTAADPETRRTENRQRIEQNKAKLLYGRDVLNDSGNPNIRDALDTALGAHVGLAAPRRFHWLQDVLVPRSDSHVYVLENSKAEADLRRLAFYGRLPPAQWEYRCGAADRILRDTCGDPIIQQRDGATWNVRSFINDGGVFLGIGNGNVNRQSQAFLFNSLFLDIIDAARKGIDRKCVVVLEEAQSGGLLTPLVGRSMLEIRESGVEVRLNTQNLLALPNKQLLEEIIGNIRRFVVFGQVSPTAVRHKAEILATPGIDPYLIHSTEYTTKSIDAGWEQIGTESKTVTVDADGRKRKGVTKGTAYRRRTDRITEARHHYVSRPDQITDYETKVTRFGVGDFAIREGDAVYFEHVQMLEKPWDGLLYSRRPPITLADKKFELALEAIKARPEYRTPTIVFPPKAADTRKNGETATDKSSNGSTTPTRFRKSSTSSRIAKKSNGTRKPTAGSNGS